MYMSCELKQQRGWDTVVADLSQQLWPVQPLEQWQCWRKTIFEEFQGAAGIVELQGNCV